MMIGTNASLMVADTSRDIKRAEEYWLGLAEALNRAFDGSYKGEIEPIDWTPIESGTDD